MAFETLIKELEGANGKLFMLKGGKRLALSDCKLKIRIYEEKKEIPTLGGIGRTKSYYAALAICRDINDRVDVRDIDRGYFEIETDIGTGYHKCERVLLDQLAAVEFDSIGEWTFEILDIKTIIHLLRM